MNLIYSGEGMGGERWSWDRGLKGEMYDEEGSLVNSELRGASWSRIQSSTGEQKITEEEKKKIL